MNNKILFLLVIAVLTAGLVYYWSSPAAKKQSETPDTNSVATVKDSAGDASADTMNIPPVGEDLAPGTAIVRLKIVSISYSEDDPSQITGKVEEVLGYGSSTSPIAVESEILLNVASFLQVNSSKKDAFKEDATLLVKLAEATKMQGMNGGGQGTSWMINELIE